MKYDKPPLTFNAQADLLISRGLVADQDQLVDKLRAVNYYRLSGYLYPYLNPNGIFKEGTTLKDVWRRYTFDRQLRLLVLDAIERVEVSIRTSLVYHHCHAFGAFGYLKGTSLPNLEKNSFLILQSKLRNSVEQSKAVFVIHFKQKYGDMHSELPLWILAELMSFGMMFTLFRGVEKQIKRNIANDYGIAFGVLESWLYSLNAIRNICAHHGRLWNRVLGIKPMVPAKDRKWHSPVQVANDRMFCILTLLKYMLGYVAPDSKWDQRLIRLFNEYEDIPKRPMGFSENWKDCPIWAE
jgi:abortive infection bacteriophage resistance protein